MSADLLRYAPAWLRTHWAKLLAGVLATVLLLALAAPYLLNVDRYRGRIADLISLQTGRKVTLGRLRATVLPRIGFTVEGFQMANPPGFPQGQMVQAQEIRGALAFWPLVLGRELRVISLELVAPRLMLLEDGRGRNNYTFPSRSSAASTFTRRMLAAGVAAPDPDPASASSPASLTLMVDRVAMSRASVSYGTVDRRGRPAATAHVSNLDLELRQIALRPMRIHEWQGDARLGGTQLMLSGWNTPILFESGTVMLRGGKLDSAFTVRFGQAARVEGKVTVLDVENAVPQFDLQTDDLDVDALLAGTADPIRARGNFNATGPAPAPARGGRPRVPGTAVRAAMPPATTPAPGPSRLVANGRLAADLVRQGNHVAGPLTADLRIFTDRTEIWPFTLRLAGGAVQLTARTDRLQTPQRFSANLQVRGLNTERMLRDSPGLRGKLAGTTDLELQLIGSLETHWTESLTGKGQFVIRNGRIAGFNLTGAAQSLASLAGVRGDTPFTRIAGDLDIRNERIVSRQIHMDSPRGTLDLKGSSGFYGALDYEGQMIAPLGDGSKPASAGTLDETTPRNRQITVPFLLRGTVQQPQFRPGLSAPKFGQSAPSAQPHEPNGFTSPSLFGK